MKVCGRIQYIYIYIYWNHCMYIHGKKILVPLYVRNKCNLVLFILLYLMLVALKSKCRLTLEVGFCIFMTTHNHPSPHYLKLWCLFSYVKIWCTWGVSSNVHSLWKMSLWDNYEHTPWLWVYYIWCLLWYPPSYGSKCSSWHFLAMEFNPENHNFIHMIISRKWVFALSCGWRLVMFSWIIGKLTTCAPWSYATC